MSDDVALAAVKVFAVGRQLLDWLGRNAPVKLVRISEAFVEKRLCPQHAKVGKRAATEQNTIGSNKRIIADADRKRCLAISLNIDAVRHDLRLKASEGAEIANADRVGAINEMAMGDGGMFAQNQLRTPVRFRGKMRRRPQWKTSDPISPTNRRLRLQMKEIDVFANRQMADTASLFHDQPGRKNAGEPDPAAWMNLIIELLLQKSASQSPWKESAKKEENLFHISAPSRR